METYFDERFGTFTVNRFTYPGAETYYSIDGYTIETYTLSILVFTDTIDGVKNCLENICAITEHIKELDASARNIFKKKLGASKKDLNEIELNGIWYYTDTYFEFLYDLPEDAGFEYVKAIFDNHKAVDATIDNY